MAEEYRIAWTIYTVATLVLLLAGWWFTRTWSWAWLRRLLLITFAAVLLMPARPMAPDAVAVPVLPLFVYQMLFEEEGAAPEVTANLVFAAGGALTLMALWGLAVLYLGYRREKRQRFQEDPYFDEQ
ncbi:hypothetical protein [Microbulbifer thermotolerans]|uniref:MFS transporter n=1 Tax=Microbulbifer thermotolerans TaxID=252514 RepID=A0AB35HYV7_MICTH|nr:hypothetical protein [Microbulbifer thermotolerans]MCX2780065.1 hypothetical protein [Microbulbifer thermotolerans]MCX2802091.1 hypothetical protein [Microbulbifer thermotolerans]MCX2805489.1 hypothetical protein [Microbulbifer thermotolerans]MCX2835580.1 hypothetical protein [Microbulbifer thermotolerans]MCX2842944.1 hypothetical protein [Microbulbifer thermotolerans]